MVAQLEKDSQDTRANGPAAIVRADGITAAERLLKRLCDHSFLSMWSYSGIYRDQGRPNQKGDGKEVCDYILSDRSILADSLRAGTLQSARTSIRDAFRAEGECREFVCSLSPMCSPWNSIRSRPKLRLQQFGALSVSDAAYHSQAIQPGLHDEVEAHLARSLNLVS